LCTSVLGSIQPGPMYGYIAQATGNGADADGFLQRIQLLVWPDEFPEWKNVDRLPDVDARERICNIFAMLASCDPSNS